MPDTVNVHREVISIETDQSRANQTRQRIREFRAELQDARKEVLRLNDAFKDDRNELGRFASGVDKTRLRSAALRQELTADISVLSDLRAGFDDVARSEQLAADNARNFGRVSSGLRDVSQAARVVGGGAAAGPINAASQLLEVNRAADRLREGLPALISGLELTRLKVVGIGVAAVAAAGVGILISQLSKAREEEQQRLQELTRATENYLNSLVELEAFLLDATFRDIGQRRDQAERDAAAAQAGLDALAQQQLDLQTQLLNIIDPDLVAQAAGELLPVDDLIELTKIYGIADEEVRDLRAQLEAFANVAEDTQEIYDGATREAEILSQAIRDMATEAGGLVDKTGKATKTVRDLSEAVEVLGTGKTGFREGPIRKQGIPDFADRISGNVNEAAARALIAVNDKLAGQNEELAKSQEDAAKATDKLTKLTDKYGQTLDREAQDFALERTRDLADHYAELAGIDADFYAEREDILADISGDLAGLDQDRIKEARDINRDLQRLAKDHRDRMFQIERNSRRDLLRAARRLDGIAAFDARQAKQDALEDENNQFDTEKDRREEDFRERVQELEDQRRERQEAGMDALRDLEEQHRQERSAKVLDFRLRLAREDEDRAIRLSRLQQDHIAQRNEILKSFADQINLTNQHYGTMLAVTQFGMQGVTGLILTEWLNLQAQITPTQAVGTQGIGGGFRDFPAGSSTINVQGDGVLSDLIRESIVDAFEDIF